MAVDNSRPAIPAWQRAHQQQPATEKKNEDIKSEEPAASADTGAETPTDVAIPTPEEPAVALATEVSTAEDASSESQLHNMRTFLEDPAVKNASIEKKRAFLEGKGISKDLIEQVLRQEASRFNIDDFASFAKTQREPKEVQVPTPPPQQQKPTGPPIITYPEFLVEAHKPPPLITPGRIINTAYFVSGLTALLYGASKYLIAPMSENLSEARHEFAMHSQSKIDEMNERLGKLVSKVPEPKKDTASDIDISEIDSETSDPTELYHRDIGTQTSPPPSPKPSVAGLPTAEKKKDMVAYQSNGLEIMKSHLEEMLQRTEALEQPNKDRADSVNKLRHYLDTLMYASPGISVWSTAEDTNKAGNEDMVEELKKEIRGVKGVLLSAKRFPGVAGRVGA